MITSYEIQYDSCEKNKSAHLRMKSRGMVLKCRHFLKFFINFLQENIEKYNSKSPYYYRFSIIHSIFPWFFVLFFIFSFFLTANKNHYFYGLLWLICFYFYCYEMRLWKICYLLFLFNYWKARILSAKLVTEVSLYQRSRTWNK